MEWPVTTFSATATVSPRVHADEGIITRLDLILGAHYTIFTGDGDETIERAELNAMRSIAWVLYQDVLEDLRAITQAVGDGKRREAMTLLNALFVRLNSNG